MPLRFRGSSATSMHECYCCHCCGFRRRGVSEEAGAPEASPT